MPDPVSSAFSGAAHGAAAGSIVPGWGTAIGAVVGLGAGLISYFIQAGELERAQALIKAAQDKYNQVTDATLAAAARDTLGPNALAQIQQDPSFQRAQQQSLAALKGISDSGGITAADRAALNETMGKSAHAAEQSREAIANTLSRNGLFGSGAGAEAALESQQAQQNTNAQAAQNLFGQEQARALQAIVDRGGLAAQMQAADWQRQSDVARAQNERDQLLWGNRQDLYRQRLGLAGQQYGFAMQNAGMMNQQANLGASAIANAGHDLGGALIGWDAVTQRDRAAQQNGQGGGTSSQPLAGATGGYAGPSDPSASITDAYAPSRPPPSDQNYHAVSTDDDPQASWYHVASGS